MFKKNFTLVFILSLVLWSCDELGIDPIKITVPANAAYTFDISAATINANANKEVEIAETVDIAALVDGNADKIDATKVKEMTFKISGYNQTSGEDVLANFSVKTRSNGSTTEVVSLSNVALSNTEIELFKDGQATNLVSQSLVRGVESLLANGNPFELIVTGKLTGNADSDFKITISWELDITVEE